MLAIKVEEMSEQSRRITVALRLIKIRVGRGWEKVRWEG